MQIHAGIITVSVDAENDPPISSDIASMERNDGDTISLNISGNFVDPEGLSTLQREQLVDALKVIDRMRKQARSEFTGALW
mgnify:CR=1 FL=1